MHAAPIRLRAAGCMTSVYKQGAGGGSAHWLRQGRLNLRQLASELLTQPPDFSLPHLSAGATCRLFLRRQTCGRRSGRGRAPHHHLPRPRDGPRLQLFASRADRLCSYQHHSRQPACCRSPPAGLSRNLGCTHSLWSDWRHALRVGRSDRPLGETAAGLLNWMHPRPTAASAPPG